MSSDPQATRAPVELPADPVRFWAAGDEVDALADAADASQPPALERMGASPFSKSGFPVLGFLATVYEHVAAHAARRTNGK